MDSRSSSSQDSEEETNQEVGKDEKTKVLVTGGAGYLGSYIVKELLERGMSVKVSVQDLADEKRYSHLKLFEGQERLEIVEGKLTNRECWKNILEGCQAVIHTASPNPFKAPKQELEVIYPAVEGTLNILMAAAALGIKRVIMTSCYSAVRGSKWILDYKEDHWGEPNNVTCVDKSKIFAERSAWYFTNENKGKIDLTTICPGFLIGPCLQKHFDFASGQFFKKFMDGRVNSLLDIYIPFVDVRDAAKLHIQALWNEASRNQRYLCVNSTVPYTDLSNVLSRLFKGKDAFFRFPTDTIPALPLKLIALFDSNVQTLLPFYGKSKVCAFSKTKLENDFKGFKFETFENSLKEMGVNFIKKGFVDRVQEKTEKDFKNEEEDEDVANLQVPDLCERK